MSDKSNTQLLAEFYADLFKHLLAQDLDKDFAMRIVLKEAKVPRQKIVQKESDMGKMIRDALKGIRSDKDAKSRQTRPKSKKPKTIKA